jgi:hypothetical protein
MSLSGARGELLAALEAASIPVYYGADVFTAPCARVYPGEPWVAASGFAGGRRTQRWELWAVAGKPDSMATFDELEALVQSINDAVDGMQGWSFPAWSRPAPTLMGGTRYLACRGVVETLKEV